MTDSPSPDARRFVYRDGSLVGVALAPDDRQGLEVADSWLVDSGRVRAIDLHRQRFMRSAEAAGFDDETALADFWAAAVSAIPPIHRWFPRAELSRTRSGRWELSILMRLAPPLSASVVLRTHAGPDPRSIRNRKGPDLLTLASLRDEARIDGVDELVLLGPDGAVADGTTTALLWWRGDELRMPPPDLERVDSVTARSVLVLAAALGVRAGSERVRPADLGGTEVWAVNALHGIRVVSAWRGGPAVVAEPGRQALWQRRLGALARPLAP
ncbi:aminotransferase class IV [Subtercola boreus]|uniref:Aminotransferase class IV n=1 Tax=Subtercola boreus TaxID=120213 RepID=A0A3E0WCU9_9MICO|nr:aminotransferase class IV [Subtercola boreus]RFA21803.1 hypothetical protein B7R24_05835 [Subtercola boreus]RFA21914.1 hypothetical protein B7R23_05780 [Subtercola boreus]RFA27862.1 hypothetical protein B7R25_05905 [Subtercola boreus]